MEHRICGCHSHRPSLRVLGYKTQGINEKWWKQWHSRALHICYTYNYVRLGHAARTIKCKNRILQPAGKFLLPSWFFLQQRAVLVSSSRMQLNTKRYCKHKGTSTKWQSKCHVSLKVTVLDSQEALQRSNVLNWTWVVCVNKETLREESTAARCHQLLPS